ncbi:hypothetical protein M076_3624 [Bacteroides fragilis str. 2-F-2 |uniref:Uncharacterized protein n=1 Tax=Bacteroides fragilis str. 2-F-2 \|nr:hypothetical protein M078_3606 [Bacteroides fragilis str. 2-F-2 \
MELFFVLGLFHIAKFWIKSRIWKYRVKSLIDKQYDEAKK